MRIAGLSLLIASWVAGAAAQDSLKLTDATWIAPGSDAVRVLTVEPAECLAPPEDRETAHAVEVGRAAFRSPFLLGGQAARAGLSCESCHRNGHDNPDFHLDGLSGAPGTADVTSAHFSTVREDEAFNPVPIPSLVDSANKQAFGTTAPVPSLRVFIDSAIREEFQGADPAEPVLDGLVAYIAHLKSSACGDAETVPVTEDTFLKDIDRALDAADGALARGHGQTADFLTVTVQGLLGRLHARYGLPGLDTERAMIEGRAGRLKRIRRLIAWGELEDARTVLKDVRTRIGYAGNTLRKARDRSLFNPDVLRAHLP